MRRYIGLIIEQISELQGLKIYCKGIVAIAFISLSQFLIGAIGIPLNSFYVIASKLYPEIVVACFYSYGPVPLLLNFKTYRSAAVGSAL